MKSAAIVSGGSTVSTSVTPWSSTVTVHVSPVAKSVVGSSVYVVVPPESTNGCAPLAVQEIVNVALATETGSLNVMPTLALRRHVDRAVRRSRARDRRGSVGRRRAGGVRAEPVERVGRKAVPLDGGIEGVRAVRVAVGDDGLATQRVVGGARRDPSPTRCRDRSRPGRSRRSPSCPCAGRPRRRR